jgi:hypothetical protein
MPSEQQHAGEPIRTAMNVYHRTAHASAILREGFRDGEGTYMTTEWHRGVWVSADCPLDINEGAVGDAVTEIVIPQDLFERHEWVEELKTYREALVPADDLNNYPARVLTEDEIDELEQRWADGIA